MLQELYVRNLVVFSDATLPFAPGLNVISGETGAGKSLIAGAIGLALGARANSDLIRAGEDTAVISAIFSLPDRTQKELRRLIEEAGADPETEESLIFERRLAQAKPGRLSLCGRPVSAGAVTPLAGALIDIAAQNEHTRLVEPAYQRELLDAFGKISAAAYSDKFRQALELLRRLEASEAQKERTRLELERIRFKLEKIAAFGFDPSADPQLEARISAMSNAEGIREAAAEGAQILYESDGAVTERVGAVLRKLEDVCECSPAAAEAAECLRSALAAIEDGTRALQQAGDDLDFTPEELDAAITRAEEMKALARLLECPERDLPVPEQIPLMESRLRARESELAAWEIDGTQAQTQLESLCREIVALGADLSEKRRRAGGKLAKAVNAELADLGMPQANFSVELRPRWREGEALRKVLEAADSGGIEEICFLLAPNPGEAPSSLAETASGGESSRTMLAIKSALAAAHCPPTLLFDEIDSGVGGRLGEVLGQKLSALARERQIIVITHLPQIAAHADNHIKIAKSVRDGRTTTNFVRLEGEERVEEIAHMIHGSAATATTRQQAREMLQLAPASVATTEPAAGSAAKSGAGKPGRGRSHG